MIQNSPLYRFAWLRLIGGGVFYLLLAAGPVQAGEQGYYRWPTLHGETLVFGSEGDLWRTRLEANGHASTAQRLTRHAETESRPALSPDGRQLAFVAHYESEGDVYVMPLDGGAPKRLTHEGGRVAVVGWFDAQRVLYVTGNVPGPRAQRIRRVHVGSGVIDELPLAGANALALDAVPGSADKPAALYFSRYGLSLSSDNALLYRGGRMAQLWRWTLPRPLVDGKTLAPAAAGKFAEAQRLLADFAAPIRSPMVWNSRVYFVSDKSGHENFWSVGADGQGVRQLSAFKPAVGGQLRTASIAGDGSGRIVYQQGADLFVYDIAANSSVRVDVELVSDREPSRVRMLTEPLKYLESSIISSAGDSVTVTARGRVAQAFPGTRRRVEYALPATARARAGVVQGDFLYAVLDDNARGEIWQLPANGLGAGRALVADADAHIWSLHPSPDGKSLAYDDKRGRLWLLNLATQRKKQIASNASGSDQPFAGISWSPGGRYLAFAQVDARDLRRVHMLDTRTGRDEVITSAKYEAYAPAFSRDGKWLYFNSDRHFKASPESPWGDRNLGAVFAKRGRLFAVQLVADAPFPFAPEVETLTAGAADEADENKEKAKEGEDKDEAEPEDADVQFAGLASRIWPLPVAPNNFVAMRATEKLLFTLHAPAGGDGSFSLGSIPIEAVAAGGTAEITELAAGVSGFGVAADGKSLFVQQGKRPDVSMLVVPAEDKLPEDLAPHTLRLSDWRLRVDPADEWRQQLTDVWRLHRDFAYDPELRGLDWNAVLQAQQPALARVGHRAELNDLMGQMIANLGVLHSQVGGADLPANDERDRYVGLGAIFVPVQRGLQLQQIYQGESDLPETLGPLLQPGLDVVVGDVITRINGQPVNSLGAASRVLSGQAGQQVRLRLLRGRVERDVLVTPVDAGGERRLRYRHWVQNNARRVNTLSDGSMGYLHLEAMGSRDVASFARDFYAQLNKDGIVIDVRGNRGGNIDSWLLGNLLRKVWAFWQSPAGGEPFGNMQQAYRGHLVVLINEGTYSDGESFAAGIKALGITDLIGTRTAGAGIWLTDRNRLTDRGVARIAELPQFGLDGRWLIEGHGIGPDIEVANGPVAEYVGQDEQLAAAVTYLQKAVAERPIAKLRSQVLPAVGETGKDVDKKRR